MFTTDCFHSIEESDGDLATKERPNPSCNCGN